MRVTRGTEQGRRVRRVENLQVAVLCAGSVLALRAWRPAGGAGAGAVRVATLALWAAPVWLLLAARELSWGRAWPGSHAPVVTAHPLQSLARPGAVLLLGALACSAIYCRIDTPVRAAFVRRVPWPGLVAVLAAAMGSTCAEGHMACHLATAAPGAQLFEESCELLAYVALCMIQQAVFAYRLPARVAPARAPPVEERV